MDKGKITWFWLFLQWVYGGLAHSQVILPTKLFEGMPAGSYVSQRLEDWNFVELTHRKIFRLRLYGKLFWNEERLDCRRGISLPYYALYV